MAKGSTKGMLKAADAAAELKVTPAQVYNMIRSGLLPAQKPGRDYVIRRADLAKVPKVRKRGPKPKPAPIRNYPRTQTITIDRAARMLGIPPDEVLRLCHQGAIHQTWQHGQPRLYRGSVEWYIRTAEERKQRGR